MERVLLLSTVKGTAHPVRPFTGGGTGGPGRAPSGTFRPGNGRLTRAHAPPPAPGPLVTGMSTNRDGCDGAGAGSPPRGSAPQRSIAQP
ncbi:hypothetical protein GCM10010340_16410 [Streptomyces griseoloalbus]|nr:hypothetical protein GCM10010294_30210 [Streptomyces griseoloalbus]GGW39263.1 hypothetical protein GCM10010340_16410 [Streptomyces albaduncus]